MSLENPIENRIPTQEEISEIGKLSTSIPEKIKSIDAHLRNLEQTLNKTTNKNEYDRLETMFNQLEGMKKSIMEISSKASEIVQNPELIPTLTGDAEMDDVLRAQLAPEVTPIKTNGEANSDIELVPDESTGPVVIPAAEVNPSESVIVEQDNSNALAESVPATVISPTTAPQQEQPVIPQAPSSDLETQAQMIAQKIKNGDPLSKDDLEFRSKNWDLLESAMMKNAEQIKTIPGTTAEQILEQNSTPVENISRNLEQSRTDYVAAFQKNRVSPGSIDQARLLELKSIYDENTKKGIDEIWNQTKSRAFLIDSLRDEHRALEKEILERDTAETKARVEKSIKKMSGAAGSAFIYSLLLTGKLINDTIELAKKGVGKVVGGSGKTLEMLKKRLAEAKASAKADSGDILDPFHKLVGGKPGSRWFERGTAEEQALAKKKAEEEKKIAEASKKAAAVEQKKIDNGDKKKTPEELEASQVKGFLSKAFKSEYLGNQMTAKEESDAKRAWEKIKTIPVRGFMNPESYFDWGKDKEGKDIKKTVSDYSKAEQGLHNKIRDAYVVNPPTDNTVTLEQFIKESIKNGSLKL